MKVCYVVGAGRSGSTLLGELLGQIEGFDNAGELVFLGDALTQPGWRCGCGREMCHCPYWRVVTDHMRTPVGASAASQLHRLWAVSFRTRHCLRIYWRAKVHQRDPVPAYSAFLGDTYGAIREAHQPRVVVDTSKWPAVAMIVAMLSGFDTYVLHLVRDPRAVAFSWSRARPAASGQAGEMERYGPIGASVRWLASAVCVRTLVRRVTGTQRFRELRYEDLVERPAESVAMVLELLGESAGELPFGPDNAVQLAPTHSACGNPSRFRSGPVSIRPDEEWCEAMPWWRQAAVTVLTAPLLTVYGYPLRRDPRRQGGPRHRVRLHLRRARP